MRTAAILASLFVTASSILGTTPTEWYEESTDHKPFVRWWWHGSAVDSSGITHNLTEFADKGIGGVEITPIYGVKGNEKADIPFLSDKWMDILGHTISEAERLGLQVDMNTGTGWPFGGPHISPCHSARKLVTRSVELLPGTTLKMPLAPDEKQPDATLQRVVAVTQDSEPIDITHLAKGDTLEWCPAGQSKWKIYAIYCGHTYQKVKRAAPGGEGLVVNHFDSVAVRHYLDRFDKAFEGREHLRPHSFFNDSFEVYGSDWTENILTEFENEHGYDLALCINELLGDNGESTERKRVLHDYRMTLGRLLEENFTRVWAEWAHSHGATVRNQSHGSPANILDLYAGVDIPECESFGQTDFNIPGLPDTGPKRQSDAPLPVLKFASSAAHISGKQQTSAEALTWLTEHFRTPMSRCKPELDRIFCSGVNHIYFHGATYTPPEAPFPGRLFYAAINMSPTASWWNNSSSLFRYITRIQAFLSAGWPDSDILLYFPYEDIISRTEGRPLLLFDIHKMGRVIPDILSITERITESGYDYDYLSDRLIDSLSITAGGTLLSRGGNRYRAIVVPQGAYIPPATRAKLEKISRAGGTVIENVEISSLPIRGESLRRGGIDMIRRRNEAGGHNYFLAMLKDSVVNGWVPLAIHARSVMIFDPLTGKKGMAETRTDSAGFAEVKLQLSPGESLLLKTFPYSVDAERWRYVDHAGTPVDINKGWTIEFPFSDPPVRETFHTDSLVYWTSIPDARLTVNRGLGRYRTTVHITDPSIADDWILSLGNVMESARVTVNNREAGVVWSVPTTISIGHLLQPGTNELTIDVTSLDANRIADYERNGVKWRIFKDANIASVTGVKKFSFGDWSTIPAGLDSTVRLFPIYYE